MSEWYYIEIRGNDQVRHPPVRLAGWTFAQKDMWGNLGVNVKGFVGAALENVQKLSQELEAEMNAAVETQGEAKSETPSAPRKDDKISEPQNFDQQNQVIDDNTNVNIQDDLVDILSTNEAVEQKKPIEKKVRKNSRKQPPPTARERPTSPVNDNIAPSHGPPVEVNEVELELVTEKTKDQEDTFHCEPLPKTIPEENPPEQSLQLPQKPERVKPKRIKKVKSSPDTVKETPPVPDAVKEDLKKDSDDASEGVPIREHLIDVQQDVVVPKSSPALVKQQIEEYEIISSPPPADAETQQTPFAQPLPTDSPKHNDLQPFQFEIKPQMIPTIPGPSQQHAEPEISGPQPQPQPSSVDDLSTSTHSKVHFYETKSLEESHRHYFERKIESLHQEISVLTSQNEQLTTQLQRQGQQFENANLKLSSQMKNEMNQLNEVIAERERALQSANVQLADLHQKQEEAMGRVMSLTTELSENKKLLKQFQQTASLATGEGNEKQRELIRLQELLKEKEESLNAYAVEGQALSKKQGEMEKLMKKIRQESREKETEIVKLKESRDQLSVTIEELQELSRQQDTTVSQLQKQISVLQSVSQSSQDKITKLENEVNGKTDELSIQRKALESSWNENNDLKRTIAELKAETDSLRSQIGLGANKAVETESSRRDLEQREAILRATNRQLQESLQRQMDESSTREERMREELRETRNRWQEAIASREALTSEVGNATTPLLRQITSLQETLRIKTDSWQKMESALSERTLRAEKMAEMADKKRLSLEEEITALRQKAKESQGKLEELNDQLRTLESSLERVQRAERDSLERVQSLQVHLNEETAQRISLETALREAEYRQKRVLEQKEDEKDSQIAEYEIQITLLREQIQQQGQSGKESPGKQSQQGQGHAQQQQERDEQQQRRTSEGKKTKQQTNYAPAENESFAVSERSHQTILHKDEKIDHLSRQLQQAEASRDALLEEVSYLSSKVSSFEEGQSSLKPLRAEISKLKEQNETLLILLGEKEEELEGLMQDMKEIKELYREELNRLLEKSVAC